MTATKLISKLNRLITFDQAPTVDSWNPIKRHRQHKALQQWVDERPPSAGITASQLNRKYPRDYESERLQKKGGAIGAGVGLGAGLTAAAVGRKVAPLERAIRGVAVAATAAPIASVTGAVIADRKGIHKRMDEFNRAHQTLMKELHNDTVPRSSLKLGGTPSASTYGEVNRELKKQNVGFLKRHTVATVSRPMVWSNNNAAFLPEGDKGLIITSKNVNPIVAKHEAGHAKDYQHYGGQQGFKKAYPEYGNPVAGRDAIISDTLLPEHRAWAYANPRTKKEKEIRDAALTTYRRGMGLSALLDRLIEFGTKNPKPDQKSQAKWGAVSGGIGGVVSGGTLGAYVGALNPQSARPWMKEINKGVVESMHDLFDATNEGVGDGWKGPHQEQAPLATGRFTEAERDARKIFNKERLAKKLAIRRIGKSGLIGAGSLGALGAIAGYANARAGINKHDSRSLSAKLDKLIELGSDPRPRNNLGEYSSQQEGVADPNDMNKTYGPVKQGLTIGGAAAIGGAGGSLGSSAVKGTGKALKHVYDRIKASRVKV